MTQDQPPLVDAIDAFVAKHEMSPITFGRKAMKDPHFVAQVRNGRRLWPETEARVRQFMDEYVPEIRAAAPAEAA